MFYADTTDLSPRQSLLPSGTLWARDVVIARTGDQFYHRHELAGVDTDGMSDRQGMVRVARDEADVFDPSAMASFEGAPITMGHPEGMVDPETWKQLAVGHAQNVRRVGDHLVADLLIHDRDAIRAIRDLGWRSVSCGYEADYRPNGRGLKQISIRGNHIAVLSPSEDARCGDACMIGDAKPRRDTMRRSTRDQPVGQEQRSVGAEYRQFQQSRQVSEMGRDPGGRVGPQIVARLPYPASALSIGTDGNTGDAVVWVHSDINGRIDPGTVAAGTTNLPMAQRRLSSDAIRQRDNDERWCRQTLQGINAANRRAWGLA
jgi:hypothetical protein